MCGEYFIIIILITKSLLNKIIVLIKMKPCSII